MAKRRVVDKPTSSQALTIPAARDMMRDVLPRVYAVLGPVTTQQYLQRVAALTLADERVCVRDVVNDHSAMLSTANDMALLESVTPLLSNIVKTYRDNRALFPRPSEFHFMYSGVAATDCASHAEYTAFRDNVGRAFVDAAVQIINTECKPTVFS